MKKKYSLAIGITLCFLLYVLLSWIIPTATISSGTVTVGNTNPVGLFELILYPTLTVGVFVQFGIIILAIGGFYGVLSKTGVYSKLVNNFVKKLKGKEKLFLIILSAALMIINSVMGAPYALLITVPFFMAVLIKLGYEKITAVASTIGSILVGSLCSTFGYNVAGTAASILGVKLTSDYFIPSAIALVLVGVLFILFLLNKAQLNKKNVKEEILFVTDDVKNSKNTTPLLVVSIILVLIGIASMFNWSTIFGFTGFEKFFDDLSAIKVGTYPILTNILGLSQPFGYWDSYELTTLLIIGSFIIGWIYSVKFVDVCESFVDGMKKLLRPAAYVVMANIIIRVMLDIISNGTMLTNITNWFCNLTKEFNIFSVIGSSVVGSFFYNHYYYMFYTINDVITSVYGTEMLHIISFVAQSFYGIMMLILPTSVILVAGLTTLDVTYVDWVKYIWKFLLYTLAIILVIGIVLVLIA